MFQSRQFFTQDDMLHLQQSIKELVEKNKILTSQYEDFYNNFYNPLLKEKEKLIDDKKKLKNDNGNLEALVRSLKLKIENSEKEKVKLERLKNDDSLLMKKKQKELLEEIENFKEKERNNEKKIEKLNEVIISYTQKPNEKNKNEINENDRFFKLNEFQVFEINQKNNDIKMEMRMIQKKIEEMEQEFERSKTESNEKIEKLKRKKHMLKEEIFYLRTENQELKENAQNF